MACSRALSHKEPPVCVPPCHAPQLTRTGWPAGVTSTLAMFPLETVRTRLAVDHRRYMNVPNALRTIAAEEGVLALYRVRPWFC